MIKNDGESYGDILEKMIEEDNREHRIIDYWVMVCDVKQVS
ncbi:hypothetical protein [Dolosigranulum pigrum]|nr:hypothetical protein [Dolosigranulum pigrum]